MRFKAAGFLVHVERAMGIAAGLFGPALGKLWAQRKARRLQDHRVSRKEPRIPPRSALRHDGLGLSFASRRARGDYATVCSFRKKGRQGVHLKDQKLADVLAEFTRAEERPVSQMFWEANLSVMKAASKLTEEELSTLS